MVEVSETQAQREIAPRVHLDVSLREQATGERIIDLRYGITVVSKAPRHLPGFHTFGAAQCSAIGIVVEVALTVHPHARTGAEVVYRPELAVPGAPIFRRP